MLSILKKVILLFLILCMLIIMVSCGGNPIIPPIDEEGNIRITDMFWDSNTKVIEITLDPFPSTWGNWTMYIDGEKLPMEGGTGNPVIRPNASLDELPTGLLVGTLPWVSPLTEVDFPCCGTIQFDIPGEGLTNEYEFNLINFGCETASEEECSQTPIPSPDPEEEAIIPETTKVIEEETIQKIVSVSEDQSIITFEELTPQLEEISPGDVIVMGETVNTPEGLLRRVTNITKDGSQVIIETEFASLEEVIEQGSFEFDITLEPEDIERGFSYPKGVRLIEDKFETGYSFSYEFNKALCNNHLIVDGELSFDYHILLNGTFGLLKLKTLEFKNTVESKAELDVTLTDSFSVGDLLDDNPKTLFTIPFKKITVWVSYVPIVLKPQIDINVGLDGEIFAELTTGVTISQEDEGAYVAGVEFDNGTWKEIKNEPVFSFEFREPSLSAGAKIKAYTGPQLELMLYGIAGPYCNIYGYLDFEAGIWDNPWWELYAGLDVTAGLQLEIITKFWSAVYSSPEFDIINYRTPEPIAQADGPFGGGTNHPPEISDLSADPPSVNINQTATITCFASDEDGDPLTYHWTKNVGSFEGSTSGSSVTWRAPSTEGNYTVECEVSDGEGGKDNDSVNIVVTESDEPPPATVAPIISLVEGVDDGYVNADEVAYGLAVCGVGPAYAEIKIYINDICADTGDVLADGFWVVNVVSELDVDGTKTLYATATEDGLAESAHSNEITFILDTTGTEENGTYTITASAGSHGSISLSGSVTVNEGSDKSFTITPDTGYQIDNVLVDGSSVGAVSSYTFTNVTEDHTISATFIIEDSGTYDLRDIGPAGGWIFYDKGYYSSGWRYLEAAPVSTEWFGKEWGSYSTLIGGTGTGIGTGQSNTTIIVTWLNSHSETDRAAQLCDALTEGGYSDWFLPSKGELNLMYENLKVFGVGGFADKSYWSSSEGHANYAWDQVFYDGFHYDNAKYATDRVRAVRAF
jgi:hypothetical protein